MDDKELTRLAQQEIQQEAFRAKSRAESMGALGWQRCPLPSTNKRFLHNVVISTLEPRKKKVKQVHSTDKDKDTRRHSSSSTLQQERSELRLKSAGSSEKRSTSKDRHKHKKRHKEKRNTGEYKNRSKHKRHKKEKSS